MFEKYFNGAIELVYDKVTQTDRNVVMACYNNVFSIEGLESIKRYSAEQDDVFFAWEEYAQKSVVGAYAPFLDVVCQMHREYIKGDFDEFLKKCQVYESHRRVFNSYYNDGICKRNEPIFADELAYERYRIMKTLALMLKEVAEYKPIVIVINGFERASKNTLEFIELYMKEPSSKVGILLGVNEGHIRRDSRSEIWDTVYDMLTDMGQVYHLGSSDQKQVEAHHTISTKHEDYAELLIELNNLMELLEYDQLNNYLINIERQIKYEDTRIPDNVKLELFFLYTKVAIRLGDIPKAWDIIENISNISVPQREDYISFQTSFDIAMCYMFQGKSNNAYRYAQLAKEYAVKMEDEERIFQAEVLMLRSQMEGWHNVLFCTQDVEVEPKLLEKLVHYGYRNHLAYIYVYAYDNAPEVIAKAYRAESALPHFTKGVNLAKELDNEILVYSAYQKNIMIASANGMNEIALLYAIRNYQHIQVRDSMQTGRMLDSIGYNLSALGHVEDAIEFYDYAISIFYFRQLPEEIAEVCCNLTISYIALNKYDMAEKFIKLALKTIGRLNLNGLRENSLAKLNALHALLSDLHGRNFEAERYLLNCRRFLNANATNQEKVLLGDCNAKEEDISLYYIATALHRMNSGDLEEAFEAFEEAEKYFLQAEGNLFYIHSLYRKSRMDLYQKMGRIELYMLERESLLQHETMVSQVAAGVSMVITDEIRQECKTLQPVSKEQIEDLLRQESLSREGAHNKRQLNFISIWQNLLDKSDVRIYEMVKTAISLFLKYFNNDCAMYVRYDGDVPRVLYNDTEVFFTEEKLLELAGQLAEYPRGIAVSRIGSTFSEYKNLIDMFGGEEICSFVAIPFFKDGKMESFFITCIKTKVSWNDPVGQYLLNESDINVYQLLFRDLDYAITRLESYREIYQMNKRLQEAATTDVLTGITNRMGLYERIHTLVCDRRRIQGLGVMFIDLDNFKPYNDAYGHEIGDVVLQSMARIFEEAAGDKGFVCRYGGDEFIIITYSHKKDDIEKIAKDIYAKIEQADGFEDKIAAILRREIEVDTKRKIGCSIGITTCEEFVDENYVDYMIRIADEKLYSVKATGKGKYVFA